MAKLLINQAYCTTPALDFWPGGVTPERTGVSTDDHGWAKYSSTSDFPLHINTKRESIGVGDDAISWSVGYYFTNGQASNGQYEEVVRTRFRTSGGSDLVAARLYNVSGVQKFRLWNVDTDTQIGSDSVAITVGTTLLVTLRVDSVANTITLFINGVSKVSNALTSIGQSIQLSAGQASTGTIRYWSAWALYLSASDDLNEAHYPEMRMIHPEGEGFHGDYKDGSGGAATFGRWDDLASEGDPDGDTEFNVGNDLDDQIETSTLTTHTMTNTIQGLNVLCSLRQDIASKSLPHGMIIRSSSTDKVVSFATEEVGTVYVPREATFHTPPDGAPSWNQGDDIDNLEAGHRRDAAADPLNIRITALAVNVVALGTTNLAPPDPPSPPAAVGRRRVHMQLV